MTTDLKPSTARAVTDGEIVLATVDVAGPPERAFQALNTAETERWWGSADTYRMVGWTSDVRLGGHWRVDIHFNGSVPVTASGEFLDVDAPHKVVLTRVYEFDHPTLGRRPTTVTYRCEPIATGTRVTVRHEGFEHAQAAAHEHAYGWERMLGWLAAYLASPNTAA